MAVLPIQCEEFQRSPNDKGTFFVTPAFMCNGHEWDLEVYPGGGDVAPEYEGYVSIYLSHRSEGNITANFALSIIDKFGKQKKARQITNGFEGIEAWSGFHDFILRSDILDESRNILDSDGALKILVSIEDEQSDVFVPKNPVRNMIQGMFLDENTADVCFEVISCAEVRGEQKRAKSSDFFHAHSQILKACAPMLANLFDLESDGKVVTASITDVKPDIFRHLLSYVYGGSVPEKELKSHAKAIIDAADKYSIINLKLKAEAAYVKSSEITIDNAMDNLLYADAKNCALLKEAVMKFLAENNTDAVEKISFTNFPGHLVKDLLVLFRGKANKDARGGYENFYFMDHNELKRKVEEKGLDVGDGSDDAMINALEAQAALDELPTLSVSALRRKCHKQGLSVDGSREAMIESIKNNS
jgi:hypothetical protein